MPDQYRARLEEILHEVVDLYGQATEAIHHVRPDLLEVLSTRRGELLATLRDLSAESYMGRAGEPWLLALAAGVHEAEEAFEQALLASFAEQREQLKLSRQANKARRAYTLAA